VNAINGWIAGKTDKDLKLQDEELSKGNEMENITWTYFLALSKI
jgi:hypothetical protein